MRYIPEMRKNLISLGELDTKGYQCIFSKGMLNVMANDQVIIQAQKQSKNLYMLQGTTVQGAALAASSPEEMSYLWHSRLGHMSEKGLAMLHKQNLLSGLRSSKLEFCEHCVFGKHKRSLFGVGTHSSTELLAYIHSDMWGQSPLSSLFGKDYYVSLVDDYSWFVWVYFLDKKSDVFSIFKQWQAQVET